MESLRFERRFGLLHASALNMSNMVGIGPFITIPIIIGTMGGPQCMLGWLVGVLIALSDGMVWAELSSAMPGSGGYLPVFEEGLRAISPGKGDAFSLHMAIHTERPSRGGIRHNRNFHVRELLLEIDDSGSRQMGGCLRCCSGHPDALPADQLHRQGHGHSLVGDDRHGGMDHCVGPASF